MIVGGGKGRGNGRDTDDWGNRSDDNSDGAGGSVWVSEDIVMKCFERQVPGYPRYTYSGDPALGEHHLVISGITITEDGEYQCQVGPTQTNPPIWAAANVTVLVAPTGITILGWEDGAVVEMVAGASLVLECLVTDARPAAIIMWHKDGLLLDQGLVEERVEASSQPRRWSVRSRLSVTAAPEDDGKLYTCEADHPALRRSSDPLLASITLSVLREYCYLLASITLFVLREYLYLLASIILSVLLEYHYLLASITISVLHEYVYLLASITLRSP
ncbi:nephrin [Cherax quadricarinatus]|uniref:nephrin n=1 Tax=Cherax quadricarinatus TaxID=27406 RepID=UPI002378790C|nr:nephrin-like [Cherax quadricarinatus]